MKLNQIPPIPGADSIFSLLEFLRDPAKVEERLKLLEEARQDINKRLVAIKDLSDIQNLQEEARLDRELAARELKAARDLIAAESKAAKDSISVEFQTLEAERKTILESRAKLSEDLAVYRRDFKQLEEDRRKVEWDRSETQREATKAAQIMDQARKKKQDVDELLSKSKQVLSA